MGGAGPGGECALELGTGPPERELTGAQHLEHALLLGVTEHRARERDRLLGHDGRAGVTRSRGWRRTTCMPYSSESTSASHEASMTFSETPIVPHTSSPSEVSSSTRVTAPVPFASSRMRT